MDIPGLLTPQNQNSSGNALANALRNLTGLLDTARPAVRNALAGLLSQSPLYQAYQDPQKAKNNLIDALSGKAFSNASIRANPHLQDDAMAMAMNFAPVGMIAYHGSPHTFDKFSLDKIGTGEGAQAYGHGLYLAESPEVAKAYRESLSGQGTVSGTPVKVYANNSAHTNPSAMRALEHTQGNVDEAISFMESMKGMMPAMDKGIDADIAYLKANRDILGYNDGALYKTDIPDEAVARFLDWDKSVSQQHPEVQKAIKKIAQEHGGRIPLLSESLQPFELKNTTGASLYSLLSKNSYGSAGNPVEATGLLQKAGIPGIRYLDGGSRNTGAGTSNFVTFSPDMIRILERNGQPTGQSPWSPGEWARTGNQ